MMFFFFINILLCNLSKGYPFLNNDKIITIVISAVALIKERLRNDLLYLTSRHQSQMNKI
jgi:hypothetical protein